MAPLRPLPPSTSVPRKSILKDKSQPKKLQSETLFSTTKRDKRAIKHAHLMSKIEKSSKTKQRRRRPNNKLATTLESLADALPDDNNDESNHVTGSKPGDQVNIIKRKSLKSKPGAMKRREKVDKGERDRFAKNLSQMAATRASSGSQSVAPQAQERWKALRSFISQTMERKPA